MAANDKPRDRARASVGSDQVKDTAKSLINDFTKLETTGQLTDEQVSEFASRLSIIRQQASQRSGSDEARSALILHRMISEKQIKIINKMSALIAESIKKSQENNEAFTEPRIINLQISLISLLEKLDALKSSATESALAKDYILKLLNRKPIFTPKLADFFTINDHLKVISNPKMSEMPEMVFDVLSLLLGDLKKLKEDQIPILYPEFLKILNDTISKYKALVSNHISKSSSIGMNDKKSTLVLKQETDPKLAIQLDEIKKRPIQDADKLNILLNDIETLQRTLKFSMAVEAQPVAASVNPLQEKIVMIDEGIEEFEEEHVTDANSSSAKSSPNILGALGVIAQTTPTRNTVSRISQAEKPDESDDAAAVKIILTTPNPVVRFFKLIGAAIAGASDAFTRFMASGDAAVKAKANLSTQQTKVVIEEISKIHSKMQNGTANANDFNNLNDLLKRAKSQLSSGDINVVNDEVDKLNLASNKYHVKLPTAKEPASASPVTTHSALTSSKPSLSGMYAKPDSPARQRSNATTRVAPLRGPKRSRGE